MSCLISTINTCPLCLQNTILLTYTRWSEQIDDKTLSLAFDEVVETKLLVMRFDQGLEESFAARGDDQVRKRVFVPLHIIY
jgi:hypothetical protein